MDLCYETGTYTPSRTITHLKESVIILTCVFTDARYGKVNAVLSIALRNSTDISAKNADIMHFLAKQ
jgi:hypothetical protein